MIRRGLENRPTLLSWLRNRFFRKGHERSSGEYARLYAYLSELRAHAPSRLSSIAAIPGLPGQLALLEFRDPGLRVYSGLEIVLFDDRRYLYYRMPGARPNGGGHVAPGTYRVRCNALHERRELFLVLERLASPAFRLVAHGVGAPPLPGRYARLEAGELDYSWIVGELRGLVLRTLEALPDGAASNEPGGAPPDAREADRAERERLALLARRCPPDDLDTWRAASDLAARLDRLASPYEASRAEASDGRVTPRVRAS